MSLESQRVFKSEIRNSRAQPRRARAAAQSVRTCGAITRGRSRQHAVGARLAERASAARSRRSASTTLAAPCMQPACEYWRSSARWPAARQLQQQLVLPLRSSNSALQRRRRRKRQSKKITSDTCANSCVLLAASLLAKLACCCDAARRQPQQQPQLQHIMIRS